MTTSEKYFALLPLAVLCGACAYLSLSHPLHDFANYYFGGKFFANGTFARDIYFPYVFNSRIAESGTHTFAAFAPNTPFLAMLFSPLGLLPAGVAKMTFNMLSISLFVVGIYRLAAFHHVRPFYLLLLPLVLFLPLRNELLFGQVYLLLFFLLAECWLAYNQKRPVVSALCLSGAILLKVFPVLLLLFFLLRKSYRIVVWTALFSAGLAGFTLLFCPFDAWVFWLTDVLPKASGGAITSAYVDSYQSVYMFLKHALVFDPVENPSAATIPWLFSGLLVAWKAALVTIGIYLSRRAETAVAFSFWIFAMFALSPYGSTYGFILLALPMLLLQPVKGKPLWPLLFVILANLPPEKLLALPFPVSYLRLFVLVFILVLLVWFHRKSVQWKMVSGITAAFFLCGCLMPLPPVTSVNVTPDKMLVFDYAVRDGRIQYRYWTDDGAKTACLPVPVSAVAAADVSQNSIYFLGKRLATENGNIRKPVIINGHSLYYLSDSGRGNGFYTLRKCDL